MLVHDNGDGTFTCDLNTCEIGTHVVHVRWNDKDIPGCPYKVNIGTHAAVKRVRVYGTGLNSRPLDGTPGLIRIVHGEADGSGRASVKLSGPEDSDLKMRSWVEETDERMFNLEFNPNVAGVYCLRVCWVDTKGSEHEVAGSPFEILLATCKDDVETWKNLLRDSNIARLEEFQ